MLNEKNKRFSIQYLPTRPDGSSTDANGENGSANFLIENFSTSFGSNKLDSWGVSTVGPDWLILKGKSFTNQQQMADFHFFIFPWENGNRRRRRRRRLGRSRSSRVRKLFM